MPKTPDTVTPPQRVDRWKKMWGSLRVLSTEETELAFEEFCEALVPRHMHKKFLQLFGVPKAPFGNRFFAEESSYRDWDTRLSTFFTSGTDHAEAIVIYGSPDALEAHYLRGQVRRTLRDIIIDDWFAACAIVRAAGTVLYVFVEPKMRGVIVLSQKDPNWVGEDPEPLETAPDDNPD